MSLEESVQHVLMNAIQEVNIDRERKKNQNLNLIIFS